MNPFTLSAGRRPESKRASRRRCAPFDCGALRAPPLRVSLAIALTAAASALAAPLPFHDGVEPPEAAFSSWTSTRVNGANALVQSTARAFGETSALTLTYAGTAANAQAAAVVDFASSTTTPYVS